MFSLEKDNFKKKDEDLEKAAPRIEECEHDFDQGWQEREAIEIADEILRRIDELNKDPSHQEWLKINTDIRRPPVQRKLFFIIVFVLYRISISAAKNGVENVSYWKVTMESFATLFMRAFICDLLGLDLLFLTLFCELLLPYLLHLH
ncbi:Oidioi.mRNA.OKI2018_I69.XSR.g13717.t1.cds [Oikopleura dioica]|uniref:Oidioi.mRNA.OKI2018_I69.XSR.g13717.t1.cds n=1 Tax=Oikopleura dioica TaxID=34765 RepID=A0ABN7SCG0_OIKDI|nr:Oidioi.mRNA.OKI2018_I69.XSR.g13717.t1.cds [Oikopleura dioica]